MGAEAVRRWQATRTGPRPVRPRAPWARATFAALGVSAERLAWRRARGPGGSVTGPDPGPGTAFTDGPRSRSRDGAPLEAATPTRLVLNLLHLLVCSVQRGRGCVSDGGTGPGNARRELVLPYRLLYAAYMRTCVGCGSVNYTLAFLQLQWRTTYKYSLSAASLVPDIFCFL